MAHPGQMNQPEHILRTLDQHLIQPTRLILYGRAALALGFHEPLLQFHATMGVDAILPEVEMASIEADHSFWDAIEKTNTQLQVSAHRPPLRRGSSRRYRHGVSGIRDDRHPPLWQAFLDSLTKPISALNAAKGMLSETQLSTYCPGACRYWRNHPHLCHSLGAAYPDLHLRRSRSVLDDDFLPLR